MSKEKNVIEAEAVKTLGKLSLTIHKGTDFYDTQIIGKQDPFVKLKHGAVAHQTKVIKDGGKQGLWEETFTFNILRKGESLQLSVFAHGVVTDSLIGLTFLDVDDLIKDPLPKFIRIGRDAKQSTDAGKIQISSHWAPTEAAVKPVVAGIAFIASGMPAPVTTKAGLTPLGFLPQNAELNVDLAAPNAANLTGSWRVHEKGENGKDRSYSLEIVHNPDGTLTGHGEAAHLTYAISGEVVDGRIQYKETWDNEAIDRVDALIEENGRMFTCARSNGAVTTARRLDSISKETHPLFFKFYYDLTGEWRVYYEYKEQKRSYSLFLEQHDGGRLTGHGEAGNLKYTVEGKLEKNVVSYTETWTGQGGKDEVLAKLNPAGSHFQCRTNHASVQEAKRVDAMTEGERSHKYFLPFK